jgi:sporulation protein YlmC with PRC-barrel domain
MRKIILAGTLALVAVFGYAVTESIPYEMVSKIGETSEPRELIGATIKDSQGENLGAIIDVVIGPEGRIAFAILSYWISDDTQKRVAVPFGALSCEEQDCVLNASKETLDSAPTFASEYDLAESKLAEDIYRYFGVQPYWAE